MGMIVNLIIEEEARVTFDRIVARRLAELSGGPLELAHLADPGPLPDPVGHKHLILSGSELSAASGAPRDAEVIRLIRRAAFGGTAILGICYGHQMIARALATDTACRPAENPEFGWRRLDLRENPLFAGVADLISAHSHFDEVADLPPEFEVIASTPACPVQAFQVTGLPVWGVQFHPEVDYEAGQSMFARNVAEDERAGANFIDELSDPADLAPNQRIFENFFAVGR